METRRFPAQVFWSDEDEGFIAIAPDLPGCSAFGATQEEALAELQPAIEAWLEAAQAAGNPIPSPSPPPIPSDYSGKILVRMPRSLHADLSQEAKLEGVSLNQYVVFLLTDRKSGSAKHSQLTIAGWTAWMGVSTGMTTLVSCDEGRSHGISHGTVIYPAGSGTVGTILSAAATRALAKRVHLKKTLAHG